MGNLFSFSFKGRVELLQYVYFYAQTSIIKAGNNKFQDLINAPRMPSFMTNLLYFSVKSAENSENGYLRFLLI